MNLGIVFVDELKSFNFENIIFYREEVITITKIERI
jgi:hypothetical protein